MPATSSGRSSVGSSAVSISSQSAAARSASIQLNFWNMYISGTFSLAWSAEIRAHCCTARHGANGETMQ
jgi:hypothetical protein